MGKIISKKRSIPLLQLLTSIPSGYKNEVLFNYPEDGMTNILYGRVVDRYSTGKNLIIKLQLLNSGETLKGIFFNYKEKLLNIFHIGRIDYFKGKVTRDPNFGLQIINPFPTKRPIGEITPVYRNLGIESALNEFFFPIEKFKEFNDVPIWVKEALWKIHIQPDYETVRHFEINGVFPDEIVDALKFLEAFYYIRGIKKSVVEAPSIQKLDGEVENWIKTLPFNLTNDQKKVISEVQKDLAGDLATRRIVVGDVGSGKTMVILASMVIAYPHKSILMAPTSILANQLFEEAKKFLPQNYRIELVTSKTSKKLKNLDEVDVLIGTSALIFRELPNAPLIIIDEQHRFGTKARNKLEELVKESENRPHFLQLSATPIPRTQAMINGTFIKTSLIEEIPFKKVINTDVIFSRDFPNLLKKIEEEIAKNHQVLIIYPLVEESEKINYQSLEESEAYWKKNFEDVFVTHGKDKNKEQVLIDFREKGKILLSTTVVEVGISLPRLTLIVIVGAERLGLATLHQLRGRVSRTGLQGYCYLYTKSKDENAIKRLEKFSETLNGFDIASMDLKNRKGGDIVRGEKQSGATFKWFDISNDKYIVDLVLEWLNKKD